MFKYNASFEDDIKKTLLLLCSYGGLGLRSRNGFGSIKLVDINPSDNNPIELPNLLSSISNNKETSDYTSFSKGTRIFKTKKPVETWHKALAEIGEAYKYARENLEKKHLYEKRQYIGSPIIVGKGSDAQKFLLERHAKPYFMHVNEVSENNYEGVVLFLPYKYCSKNDSVKYHNEALQKYIEITNEFNEYLLEKLVEVPWQVNKPSTSP
jgi:CRISPR-associated protein Cmr1